MKEIDEQIPYSVYPGNNGNYFTLNSKEDRYRAIVENSIHSFFLTSPDGTILETNYAASILFGYSAEEFKQLTRWQIIDHTDHVLLTALEQRKKDGFTVTEATGIKKGGEHFPIEISSSLFADAGGEGKCSTMISDISIRKKAERDLLEREYQLKAIVDTAPECIKLMDREGTILEMNISGLEMIGASNADQVLGKNALELVSQRYREDFTKLLADVFEGKSVKLEFEIVGFHKRRLYMDTLSLPLKNAAGEITAALSVTRDITEKVLLQNSLNEERELRQQQITEAVITGQEQERTELGQELHDNINQILASTKLYIECAMKDENPRPDLMAESKLLVEKAMVEIRNLSKSLLPPSLGEIGLMQALTELVENIKQVNQLGIYIKWNLEDENEMPGKLKLTIFRIAQEQLNNVIKHACAKNVVISINQKNQSLEISIKDDGLGFNPLLKRKGVGLKNISSRAEVNSGKVTLISSPGEGCELIVKFSVPTQLQKINI